MYVKRKRQGKAQNAIKYSQCHDADRGKHKTIDN